MNSQQNIHAPEVSLGAISDRCIIVAYCSVVIYLSYDSDIIKL